MDASDSLDQQLTDLAQEGQLERKVDISAEQMLNLYMLFLKQQTINYQLLTSVGALTGNKTEDAANIFLESGKSMEDLRVKTAEAFIDIIKPSLNGKTDG